MSKFKIGDRVRVLPRNKALAFSGHGAVAGEVFTVRAVRGEDGDDLDTEVWAFYEHEVEHALTLTPGEHYRARSGKPTGCVTVGDTGFEAVVDGRVRIFDRAGGAVHGDDDIVEAWVPKVGERVRVIKTENFHPAVTTETECVVDTVHGDDIWINASTESSGVLNQLAYLPDLEPLPVAPQPALVIEAGRYYKTRDGRKVGPMEHDDDDSGYPYGGAGPDGAVHWFTRTGGYWCSGATSESDLIAEWQETTNVGAQVDMLAEEYGPARVATASNDNASERKLVKTGQGYGYELARFGDYVWVDTGKTAPITLRADKVAA